MVVQAHPYPQVQTHEAVIQAAALNAAQVALHYPPSNQFYLGKDAEGKFTRNIQQVVFPSPTFSLFKEIFGGAHLHRSVDEAYDNYLKVQQALQIIWKANGWGDYIFESKRDITKLAMHLRELATNPAMLALTLRYLSWKSRAEEKANECG